MERSDQVCMPALASWLLAATILSANCDVIALSGKITNLDRASVEDQDHTIQDDERAPFGIAMHAKRQRSSHNPLTSGHSSFSISAFRAGARSGRASA
jgi:hypothetical protein